MSSAKRNFYFLLSGIVAATLIVAMAFYLFSQKSEKSRLAVAGQQKIQTANNQNLHLGSGEIKKVETASVQLVPMRAYPTATLAVAVPSKPLSEISKIKVVFRGVDLTKMTTTSPDPNHSIAYAVADAVKESPLFDKNGTKPDPKIDTDKNGTFTFGMTVQLKTPVKL